MTPSESTETTADPLAPEGTDDVTRLADRLAAAEAANDPEQRVVSRALRMELEDLSVRSRRDPVSLAAIRWSRRLASAVRRADRAENRLARLEQRRWFRIAQVTTRMLQHPLRAPGLLPDLFDAFRRRRLPTPPKRSPVGLTPPRVPATSQRPTPYAYLRVAHAGRLRTFDGIVRHIDLDEGWEAGGEAVDLLLLEPGIDEDLGEVPVDLLASLTEAGVPTLLFVRATEHLRLPHVAHVSLLVTDEPGLVQPEAGPWLVIDPSIDPRLHHPIGWLREPEGDLLDLDALPGAWGEHLVGQIKTHRAVTSTRPQMALVAAAAGTPLVAPSDPVLDRLLGDLYLSCPSRESVWSAARAMDDAGARERLSIAARRHVLSRHTRLARLEEILDHLSLRRVAPPSVSVLLATRRPERLEEAVASVANQTWPALELVLMLHDPEMFDRETVDKLISGLDIPVRVLDCPAEWALGDCLNGGLEMASGEYIAKMDDDDHYGPLHVEDLITALQYAEAAAVGKLSNVTHLSGPDVTVDWRLGDQERFVHHLPGATMLMRREIALRYRFDRVDHGVDTALWERMRADGLSLYSTHRLNFIRVRHGDHTYDRSDDDFLRLAEVAVEPGFDRDRWFA